MKKRSLRLALACSLVLWGGAALGAGEHCTAPRKSETMSEATYNGTKEATELLGKNQFDEAIAKLTKLTESGGEQRAAAPGGGTLSAAHGEEGVRDARLGHP